MRIIIFACMMLLGAGMLVQPAAAPVAAQEPQALTPSPEPPPPTIVPTATPETAPPPPPPQPPRPEPYPAPPTAAPRTPRDEPNVDLAISKSVSPSVALPGQLLTFSITVVNRGADPADGVVVTDTLPEVLSVYNATTTRGIIGVAGQTVTLELGRLQPGEEAAITIEALVNRTAPQNGFTNRVSVIGNGTGARTAQASFAVGLQATAVPPTVVPPTPSAVAASPTAAPSGIPAPTAAASQAPTAVPPHPTAAPPPRALPDTGAHVVDALGLMLLGIGALGIGLVLRRRTTG